MEEGDYFGDVTLPLHEEEEDAANDLTFGDIGDIKAGDDSDAAWNPNHQTLSSRIEAEKEALLRKRHLPDPAQPPQPNFQNTGKSPLHSTSHPIPPVGHEENNLTPWEMLKQSVAPAQSPAQSSTQAAPARPEPVLVQPLAQPDTARPLPLHTQQVYPQTMQQPVHSAIPQALHQPAHQHVHVQPPVHQARLPQHPSRRPTPEEYHRYLIACTQQQTSVLLQQHEERREKQLITAERAQQAGAAFDREQFELHQERTRQAIISDHYERLHRIRYQLVVYHHSQQAAQQHVEVPTGQVQALDLQRKINGAASPRTGVQQPPGLDADQSQGRAASMNGESGADMCRGRSTDPVQARRGFSSAGSRVKHLRDEEIENDPRMREIERQMAAAGLGPSRRGGRQSAFGASAREIRSGGSQTTSKSARRLESMTDRDQELVFRAHLRQIETSSVYRDDYYNSVMMKKGRPGAGEIFSDLSDRVHSMRIRGKERSGTRPIRIRGSKRANGNADEQLPGSSPPHSDHNMRALANALGTVQSWNPRAPRRVMDFSLLEKREPTDEDGPQKSLREDERVHVRQEIERGYDIMATIHDIARGENQVQTLAQTSEELMSTLHLSEKREDEDGKLRDHHESSRFFATMCVIPKGRRYLALVLELLYGGDKVRVMSAIFENLGMLVFASKKARGGDSVDGSAEHNLFMVMTKIVQDPDLSTQDCLHLFDSFSFSHVPHRDAFLTSFRSALGSRLIFLCMQRISAGLAKHKVAEEDLSLLHVGQFADMFTESLQDIFDGAESESRVWEVVASLDALATGESRARYRSTLNKLLRSGAVPQPPAR